MRRSQSTGDIDGRGSDDGAAEYIQYIDEGVILIIKITIFHICYQNFDNYHLHITMTKLQSDHSDEEEDETPPAPQAPTLLLPPPPVDLNSSIEVCA